MPANREVEIKFRIDNLQHLATGLQAAGFRLITPRTHEMNVLYDQRAKLRRKGALLRLREYGSAWTLTYKDRKVSQKGRHKTRREFETQIKSGDAMVQVLEALGFRPSFRYEKYRSEWSDAVGHVVVDETPIGNFGEIEGPPEWIDSTALRLNIPIESYIRESYTELFMAWRRKTKSKASDMTFASIVQK